MMRRLGLLVRRLAGDERGFALAYMTVALPVIFGTTALGIDYGYVLYVQQRLQATTNQAALAAAQGFSDGTYTAKAELYSSSASAGGINTIPGVTVTLSTTTPRCSKTMVSAGIACVGAADANVIQVTQTATVPLFFGHAIGVAPMTVSSTAYASAGGGKYPALNVIVILDTTQSMGNSDPLCSKTKIACAESGLQSILNQLYPSIDYVGLEVFPGMLTSVASYDTNCGGTPGSKGTLTASGKNANLVEYGASGFSASPATDTYTVVGLSTCTLGSGGTCYRTSNSSTSLNSSNPMVEAAGNAGTKTTGCLQAPGGEGTYFADAITQAQTNLAAFKSSLGSAGANTQNVIVILSDGDANATSGSEIVAKEASQQCHEAITAAANAASAGTWVYSIAYAANTTGGCSTDTKPSITAYCTMLEIASNSKFFYSDTTPPSGACPNGEKGPAASANIATIFQNIGAGLASARLIPQSAYSN